MELMEFRSQQGEANANSIANPMPAGHSHASGPGTYNAAIRP